MPSSKNFNANEKIICPCGGKYTKANRNRHIKTKKCLAYQKKQEDKQIEVNTALQQLNDKLFKNLGEDVWEFIHMDDRPEELLEAQMDLEEKAGELLTDEELELFERESARLRLERWEHVKKGHLQFLRDSLKNIDEQHEGFDYPISLVQHCNTVDEKIDVLDEKIKVFKKEKSFKWAEFEKEKRCKGYKKYLIEESKIDESVKRLYDEVTRQANKETFINPHSC